MSAVDRYAKLIKRAKLRNPNGSSLDFSMSANPLADFNLLIEKQWNLSNAEQIDLSWSMMEQNEVPALLALLLQHSPNLKRILISTTEQWYPSFKTIIREKNKYYLFCRKDNWGEHELPAIMPYKAKYLNMYPRPPIEPVFAPVATRDISNTKLKQ
jgi:hypothetical protein